MSVLKAEEEELSSERTAKRGERNLSSLQAYPSARLERLTFLARLDGIRDVTVVDLIDERDVQLFETILERSSWSRLPWLSVLCGTSRMNVGGGGLR